MSGTRIEVGQDIDTKLALARTRLILERPFIGALVIHLRLVGANARHCPTVATDARALYFNPEYVATLTPAQTQFVLAHEAMHCALGHFARRSHRVARRWDVACDHAVNLILIEDGMRPPPGALANTDFLGLTAEEIYPLIPPDTNERPLDAHLFESPSPTMGSAGPIAMPRPGELAHIPNAITRDGGGDAGDESQAGAAPRPTMPGEAIDTTLISGDALVDRWQARLVAAAHTAMQAGRLPDSIARSLEHFLVPRLPWRALLARYLNRVARDDYSFQRSSRRDGEALLPRLSSGAIDLIVAIDTSGSIGPAEMQEFVSEIDALKGQVRANLILHACDAMLAAEGPWRFAPWEPLTLPAVLSGGGGTRFTPVFEWIEGERLRPDALLYFTDAQGEFPPAAPPYPVIWLVKGREKVPWGERIQLN